MIEVAGFSKAFGQTRAVSDLSFQVLPGEIVGLVGPNGALVVEGLGSGGMPWPVAALAGAALQVGILLNVRPLRIRWPCDGLESPGAVAAPSRPRGAADGWWS